MNGETTAEGARGLGTGGGGQEVEMGDGEVDEAERAGKGKGEDAWVEVAVEIPGYRDDDALPVFLSAMLTEALLADGYLRDRLWINNRFHWRLYIDVSSFHSILLYPTLVLPRPISSRTTKLTKQPTDPPPLSAPLLPAPAPLSNNPPRPPPDPSPSPHLRKRRRPALQRRLERISAPIPAIHIDQPGRQTTRHATRHERSRQHHLRSEQRRTRSRGRRARPLRRTIHILNFRER